MSSNRNNSNNGNNNIKSNSCNNIKSDTHNNTFLWNRSGWVFYQRSTARRIVLRDSSKGEADTAKQRKSTFRHPTSNCPLMVYKIVN